MESLEILCKHTHCFFRANTQLELGRGATRIDPRGHRSVALSSLEHLLGGLA